MIEKKRKICILGSTGSIGTQTLDVVRQKKHFFSIETLTTNNNIEILEKQCQEFNPKQVVIADNASFEEFKKKTNYKGKILFGKNELNNVASDKSCDLIVSSLVGFAGVEPTLAAINAGIDVALANKETLVSAGEIIMDAVKLNNVNIFPIDSEHSAILQCIVGENIDDIDKVILTASGGPFFNIPEKEFHKITPEQALAHPNWSMGSKVTIDSATMMNKGFELIEAHRLFSIAIEDINILIHPQSIVHSLVQFVDSSIKAQLGRPDMRLPISYALTYPKRYKYNFESLDLAKIVRLEFFNPDLNKFTCLKIAIEAIKCGGNAPTILNAANEIAVKAFIANKIKFTDIPVIINKSLEKIQFIKTIDFDIIIQTDSETREFAETLIH